MYPGDDDTLERSSSKDFLPLLRAATRDINELLNLDETLQKVVDYSCSMTNARFGVLITLDRQGGLDRHFVTVTGSRKFRELVATIARSDLRRHFSGLPSPLRNFDLGEYASGVGLTDLADLKTGPCLATPVRYRDEILGTVLLAKDADASEFDQADEEIVGIIAALAASEIAETHRRRGEQKTTDVLEALMNASPVGFVKFNPDQPDPFTYNREAARIVGPLRIQDEPVEYLQRILNIDLADGRSISLESQPIEEIIADVKALRDEEIVLTVPDGRSVKILVNATPVHSDEGNVVSAVFAIQDLSHTQELKQLRADFLAMVGHELRGPLTSIKGSSTTLLSSMKIMDPVEVVEFVKIIDSQIDQMRHQIGSLLDTARAETGTLPVTTSPTDPIVLIDEARRDHVSDAFSVNIVVDADAHLPWVMADKRRVSQVFGNLLSATSRRYLESSSIQISVSPRDSYVEFTVAGQGIAFDSNMSPFDANGLLRTVGEQSSPGAREFGFGWALCRGLIEAQGGRIRADTEGDGSGTRFTFTLPVVDELSFARLKDGSKSSLGIDRPSVGETKILAVDDDPQTLRYVRDTLRASGYRAVVTPDPDEALRVYDIDRPDLVLLDLTLPGVDAIDLMGRMSTVAKVPIMFLSAYGMDHSVTKAMDAGAHDYITKPFAPTELIARIRSALRRKSGYSPSLPETSFVAGDLKIDYETRRVTVGDRTVSLTATEYKLLFALSLDAGRVIPHDDLLFRVWGPTSGGEIATLRTYIRRLRRQLGDDAVSPRYIFVEPRVGYRMLARDARNDIGG